MALAAYPTHVVNLGLTVSAPALPQLPSADLAVATANVAGWGGDPALFVHFLAAGLAAGPVDGAAVRQVAAIAGWRAGVLGLRDEALELLGSLPAEVGGATLGFPPPELTGFVDRQRTDRYWWPGRERAWGQVLRAGGFAGLGGYWLAPPVLAGTGGVAGRWLVQAGDTWWQLDADVFGSRLVELPDQPQCGPDTDPAGVRIATFPDSYLVSLAVPAEWNPGTPS